jgi:predicted CXXCH cytochrome family protein
MLKFFINLYIYLLLVTLFASYSLAQNIQATHFHSKEGDDQNCRICHTLQGEVKPGISDTCIACHANTVSLQGDSIRVKHVPPMNRHVMKNPLTAGKYFYNIIQDYGSIYIEYQNNRLPLFGMSPENATVECATCHEPHSESGIPNMLRIDNTQGELCDVCHELTIVALRSTEDIDSSQSISLNNDPMLPGRQNANLYNVHMWPGSQCNFCHVSSHPEADAASLVNQDRSRLCESCHEDTVTIRSDYISKNQGLPMKNHPIKFSPLDFDREKINHNIVREGKHFYVSGQTGKVPLFGETRESAIAECGTCHEPHGKSGMPYLPRIGNEKGQLCLVCHINLESEEFLYNRMLTVMN